MTCIENNHEWYLIILKLKKKKKKRIFLYSLSQSPTGDASRKVPGDARRAAQGRRKSGVERGAGGGESPSEK